MSDDTEKLLPCPFCGESKAEFVAYRPYRDPDAKYYRVQCDECHARSHGAYHLSKSGAAEEWNTRTKP